jgi:hypothetical protein
MRNISLWFEIFFGSAPRAFRSDFLFRVWRVVAVCFAMAITSRVGGVLLPSLEPTFRRGLLASVEVVGLQGGCAGSIVSRVSLFVPLADHESGGEGRVGSWIALEIIVGEFFRSRARESFREAGVDRFARRRWSAAAEIVACVEECRAIAVAGECDVGGTAIEVSRC